MFGEQIKYTCLDGAFLAHCRLWRVRVCLANQSLDAKEYLKPPGLSQKTAISLIISAITVYGREIVYMVPRRPGSRWTGGRPRLHASGSHTSRQPGRRRGARCRAYSGCATFTDHRVRADRRVDFVANNGVQLDFHDRFVRAYRCRCDAGSFTMAMPPSRRTVGRLTSPPMSPRHRSSSPERPCLQRRDALSGARAGVSLSQPTGLSRTIWSGLSRSQNCHRRDSKTPTAPTHTINY